MVMACLSASGIAFMIISRRPVTTSSMMTTPYSTHMPMACGQVICGCDLRGQHAGDGEAGGEGERHLADEAHQQGGEGRARTRSR
ncbi:hypothetical protein SGRIM128S_08552 [Streptomyces griseomycini]